MARPVFLKGVLVMQNTILYIPSHPLLSPQQEVAEIIDKIKVLLLQDDMEFQIDISHSNYENEIISEFEYEIQNLKESKILRESMQGLKTVEFGKHGSRLKAIGFK
jgi:hypothetical protein